VSDLNYPQRSKRAKVNQGNQRASYKQGTSQHDINAVERAKLALGLRKAGMALDDIAVQCGYKDRSGAYRAIKRELQRLPAEDAAELRVMETVRLDDMLKICTAKAMTGDMWAVDRVLAISKRRSELMGLDVHPDEAQVNTNYTKRIILDTGEQPA
jgi:AraC-like DNA-binding protein